MRSAVPAGVAHLIWIMAMPIGGGRNGVTIRETAMGLLARLDRHNDLLRRMADTVHADLPQALARGDLTGQELRNAVLRCTGCHCADECAGWLDAHADGAAQTPGYCRNADLLDRLQA
jgi:hypothetical protein